MTIDDARENFMSDVYNTLDFLPTNNEANRIIDSFDRVTSGLNQQPCDDCVRREEALMALTGDITDCTVEEYIARLREKLSKLPSVTPKEKTGHWVNAKVGKLFSSNDYKCSECGNILDFDGVNCGRGDANYCPNCGARMVSE